MTKLLVIGGSHSDVPLIESGILFGFDVHTTGNRPDHPGHRLSKSYMPADFSEPEQILDVACKLDVDLIVPGANDFAMMSAAYVAEKMKLPSFDSYHVTEILHRKDLFKDFANSISMPICRHVGFDTADEIGDANRLSTLKFPLVVKPVDLTGGKGMTRIASTSELLSAIQEARRLSRHQHVIAEEWFEGQLYSYSTIVENGEIIFEYFDTELCLFQDFLVSTSLSVCPVGRDAREALKASTQKMVRELQLVDGVLHCQFLASDHDVRILEYTRRMSGDLYSGVVERVCGFRHSDIFLASLMKKSLRPMLEPLRPLSPFVSRHCITASEEGYFSGLSITDDVRARIDQMVLAMPFGSRVTGDGRSKVAVVIVAFPSEDDMMKFAATCRDTLQCEISDEKHSIQ